MKIKNIYFYSIFFFINSIVILPWITYANIGSININKTLVTKKIDKDWTLYRFYKKPEITVITPKKFSLHFISQWSRAVDVAVNNNCNAVMNGTYFWYNNDGSYFPAWVWYEFWSFIREPYQPATDKNLQVLLSWNWTTIDMLDNNSFNFKSILQETNTPSRYVNAWPWLVRDGKINQTIVKNSSHRQRATTRVWVIKNPDWTLHFLVATQPISLPQFIVFAYNIGLWNWNFQFVNLDWWSSTALYTPYNSYQSRKKLPSFICL